jgi:hypothetical protein
MDGVVELDKRGQFASMVVRRGEQLELNMLVASGHFDRDCEFPITERHLEALRDDERYLFLFAALHHPFQLSATELGADDVATYLDTILFAPKDEVEAFLTELDHGQANGAISNLVHIYAKADGPAMRAGHWFRD